MCNIWIDTNMTVKFNGFNMCISFLNVMLLLSKDALKV